MKAVFPPEVQAKATMVNKGGRPKKLIANQETLKLVFSCAAVMSTIEDAAEVFNVDKKTFITFMKLTAVREAWENGRGKGKVSLRRKQFELANTNGAVALRLGEIYLEDQRAAVLEEKTAGQPQVMGDQEVFIQMTMQRPGGGELVFDPVKTIEHQPAANGSAEPIEPEPILEPESEPESEPDEPGTIYIDTEEEEEED